MLFRINSFACYIIRKYTQEAIIMGILFAHIAIGHS